MDHTNKSVAFFATTKLSIINKTKTTLLYPMETRCDVLIVGAGVTGLYIANRLLDANPSLKVIIVERGSRVGGRLESIPIVGSPIAVEAGGMRFFPDVQKRVSTLVGRLGLEPVQVPYTVPRNPAFLRRKLVAIGDLPRMASQIYNLPPSEVGKSAQDLVESPLIEVAKACGVGCDFLSTNNFQAAATRFVSWEGFNYFADSEGYSLYREDISATTLLREDMELISRPSSPQMFVRGGYAQIATRLAQLLEGRAQLLLQHELVKFVPSQVGAPTQAVVQVVDAKDIQSQITHDSVKVGAPYTIRATTMILTVPPSALAPLYDWPAYMKEDLQDLVPYEAVKVFLSFPTAWWLNLGLTGGRSVTDLPMQQVWFYTDDPPIIMIYCDGRNASFWRPLLPSAPSYPEWVDSSSVPRLRDELNRQLSSMFAPFIESGMVPAPTPTSLLWRYWPDGASFWRPLPQWKEDREIARTRKLAGTEVYVAGDAWGHYQGWVEGALHSADSVLQEYFGIQPPLPLAADGGEKLGGQ